MPKIIFVILLLYELCTLNPSLLYNFSAGFPDAKYSVNSSKPFFSA
ncbi:hypothetical protein L6E24_03300 [Methanoplanus endosymbiosus]|uniref:Uncharacterized protein n=1 Tax=Methanoplanus endosymbiosus TaxID=33865 RepID=A0A9E7PQM0_9EURY|nr:hypothetical protein [Methanoplanus endosymbiosus]UUX93161.1 hypothetical protein L6E24_03300 [Methanoplanus endosymbiosus]